MTAAAQPTHSQPLKTRLPPATTDLTAVVLIWLAACLPWLTSSRFIPYDSVDEFYPASQFVVSSLLRGEAPWWNPYIFGGQPALGDPQSMIFTPHTLVGLLAGQAYTLHVFDATTLSCLLAGGLAVWAFGRQSTNSRVLPVLGAAMFMAGGVATSRLQHVSEIVSYAWVPLQLLCLRAVCSRPGLATGSCLAASMVAGLLDLNQVTFLSVFALAPFLALHLAQSPRPRRALVVMIACGVAALAVASPVLAAIWEFVAASNRPVLPIAASARASFPLDVLSSLFMPGLYGISRPGEGLWSPTDATEDYLYIGIVPCALVLLSVTGIFRLRAIGALCLGMAAFWFVFAMGTHAPLYPALFAHVPGFAAFRRPADGAFLLNFMLALFVACSGLPDRRPVFTSASAARTAVTALGLAVVMVALWRRAEVTGHEAGLLRTGLSFALRLAVVLALAIPLLLRRTSPIGRAAGCVLMVAAVADLLGAGRFGAVCAPHYERSEAAMLYSGRKKVLARIQPLSQSLAFLQARAAEAAPERFRSEVIGGDLASSMPAVFGLAILQGNDPLAFGTYARLTGEQNLQNDAKRFSAAAPDYGAPLYRDLGLRTVLLHRYILAHAASFGAAGAAAVTTRQMLAQAPWAKLVDWPGEYEIWSLQNARPHAWIEAPDGTQAGSCATRSATNGTLDLTCHADRPATLVVSQNDAPGWLACVDGAPAEMAPAHGLFGSVRVPAGDSVVGLRYAPVPFFRTPHCSN